MLADRGVGHQPRPVRLLYTDSMLEYAAISGEAGKGSYSQSLTSGEFYTVFSIRDGEEVNLELGRNVVTKIEETIYQTPEISVQELVDLLSESFKGEIRLDLVAAKVQNGILRLAAVGEVTVRVIRRGKVINLISGGQPKEISGPVQPEDLIVLGTEEFFRTIEVQEIIARGTVLLREIRDNLVGKVENSGEQEKIAGLLLRIAARETEEAEGEVEEEAENGGVEDIEETTHDKKIDPDIDENSQNERLFPSFPGIFTNGGIRSFRLSRNFLKEITISKRKGLFLLLLLLITILAVVSFQLRSGVLEKQMELIGKVDQGANVAIGSADKLFGLNDEIARETLVAAKNEVEKQAEEILGEEWQKGQSTEAKRIKEILARLDAKIQAVSRIYKLSELAVFQDLSILKTDVDITTATAYQGQILALDGKNGSIYSVSTKTKSAEVVAGANELKNSRFLDFNGKRAYVFGNDRIFQTTLGEAGGVKEIAKDDENWGEIIDLKFFAGNIYLLDKRYNQIWKYQGTNEGFEKSTNYLVKGLSVDFSNTREMAIDGSVFVLSTSGKVAKFTGGSATEFELMGLPTPLSKPGSFFTTDETERIYIWDEETKAVMVFSKEGKYLEQYVLPEGIKMAVRKIIADETEKKIFLVTKDKIYAVNFQ